MLSIDFKKLKAVAALRQDVVPVVVQHSQSRAVLVLAYVNNEALQQSIQTGIATFWSTSRNELWIKGKTSGNSLILNEVKINCDQNSLLFLVTPAEDGVCHEIDPTTNRHYPTCYYRTYASPSLTNRS